MTRLRTLIVLAVFLGYATASTETAQMYLSDVGDLYLKHGPKESEGSVVNGVFTNTLDEDGFTYLTIVSNPQYSDAIQAYAAGYLEGNLTATLITQSYYNSYLPDEINPNFRGDTATDKVKQFVIENYAYMRTMIDSSPDDPIWYQTSLLFYQIKGMEDAYLGKPSVVSNDLDPLSNFYVFQLQLDLWDYYYKYMYSEGKMKKEDFKVGLDKCSALVRNVNGDLITSHVTWSSFSAMLRILKKYTLPFRTSSTNAATVPAETALLSSYPGVVNSIDDWIITSQDMIITETSNEYYNASLLDYVVPIGTIPYWVKITVVSRLAASGSEWSFLYKQYNQGTYNNQWIVVDYKKYNHGTVNPGTLWILETLPGTVVAQDMSYRLYTGNNAWASYNMPYFPEIQELSEQKKMEEKYGRFYSYEFCPRANIFHRFIPAVENLDDQIKLMRYNDFMNDPFALCNCEPLGRSGENAISARCDLNPVNGTYEIFSESARCHGAVDLKIANFDQVKQMKMIAISGPTHQKQPVFDWSQTAGTACEGIRHAGQPDRFDFGPVVVDL